MLNYIFKKYAKHKHHFSEVLSLVCCSYLKIHFWSTLCNIQTIAYYLHVSPDWFQRRWLITVPNMNRAITRLVQQCMGVS